MADSQPVQRQNSGMPLPASFDAGYSLDNVHDSELVASAQQGHNKAFSEIVDRYHAAIYSLIYRICGPAEAEDITQEVFLRAFSRINRFEFRNDASLRTWLYRIGMNAAINELRRMKRKRQIEGPSLDAQIRTSDGYVQRLVPDETYMPHRIAERAETCDLVHSVIRQLPAKYQQVLVLIDLEGMEYEEAAAVIGCRIGTVKSRLSRARAALSTRLKSNLRTMSR